MDGKFNCGWVNWLNENKISSLPYENENNRLKGVKTLAMKSPERG